MNNGFSLLEEGRAEPTNNIYESGQRSWGVKAFVLYLIWFHNKSHNLECERYE